MVEAPDEAAVSFIPTKVLIRKSGRRPCFKLLTIEQLRREKGGFSIENIVVTWKGETTPYLASQLTESARAKVERLLLRTIHWGWMDAADWKWLDEVVGDDEAHDEGGFAADMWFAEGGHVWRVSVDPDGIAWTWCAS